MHNQFLIHPFKHFSRIIAECLDINHLNIWTVYSEDYKKKEEKGSYKKCEHDVLKLSTINPQ